MFAQAVHQTAGVGLGTFLGIFVVTFFMRRAGKDITLLRDSPFFTALVAGMGAWTLSALMTMVVS